MSTSKELFERQGFLMIDSFLDAKECAGIVEIVESLQRAERLIDVDRVGRSSVIRFATVNGEDLEQAIPRVSQLYQEINDMVNSLVDAEIAPMANRAIGVSVNATPPGGQFAFHYDRNAITAVIYMNEVESGGEMEFYPRQRILLKNRTGAVTRRVQTALDIMTKSKLAKRWSGQKQTVMPKVGRLLIFHGNRCLHGVRPVTGECPRYSLQLAYDSPALGFSRTETNDYYGYKDAA